MPIVFDIETDGLLYDVTKCHCIVTYDTDLERIRHWYEHQKNIQPDPDREGSLQDGLDYLRNADVFVGHHIAGYDIPALDKLYPNWEGLQSPLIYDTFLGSCLLHPNQEGHSIEFWIEKLNLKGKGIKKIPITDWPSLTPEILERCHDDVLANVEVYKYLEANRWDRETWMGNMSLETQVSRIHSKQEMHGVRFDVQEGVRLVHLFDKLLGELEGEIVKGARPEVRQVGVSVSSPFKLDGSLKQVVLNWLPKDKVGKVEGPFSKLEYKYLNLRSPQQVTKFLLALGWKPNEWNFKFNPLTGKKERTSPKLTEKSWGSLPPGLGMKIGRFKMISHRRNWLLSKKKPDTNGALRTVRKETGRVPAKAMTCATPTSRYRHMETVCNLPSANVAKDGSLIWYPEEQRVLFGTELRSLLGVESDHWQIGVDLSGIEARMMVHYALAVAYGSKDPRRIEDAEDLKELVLHGDFHQHNADLWSVQRSPFAKSGLYALMFGCGAGKLASTLGKPRKEGQRWMDIFWDGNPALKFLIEQLELTYDATGVVKSIDGRVFDVREKRKLLNTLLQGSAAIVFKKWMVEVDKYCESLQSTGRGSLHQIIAYHDEVQMESYSPDRYIAEYRGKYICDLAGRVGEQLKLKVPIEAEAKCGKNWAQCH